MSKVFWGLFLVLTFVITLPISWWGLKKVDFAYPVLYEPMGIAKHIEKYAPQNTQHKKGFEQTTKAERLDLFHGVVESIQNHGVGLDTLSYSTPSTLSTRQNKKTLLFTPAEVTHLTDVAKLLDNLKPLMIGAIILWMVLVVTFYYKKVKLPSNKQLVNSTFIILLLISAVLALGPEKIFNQLHVWIFPDNHQWFFYYEESLMSTMMKAPDLFGFIAGIWSFLSILMSILILRLIQKPLLKNE